MDEHHANGSQAGNMDNKRTAVIVVDMQNDFGHPDGYVGKSGHDVSTIKAVIPAIANLVDAARRAGILVVWTKNESLPGGRSDSPAWLDYKGTAYELDAPTYTLKDSWGQQFLEPLEPQADEPVIVKYRSSAFDHTAMDLILRANGIEAVLVCGCATDACVEATARSATYHDYFTQIASDCVASTRPQMHDNSLHLFKNFFTVAESHEFVAQWDHNTPTADAD